MILVAINFTLKRTVRFGSLCEHAFQYSKIIIWIAFISGCWIHPLNAQFSITQGKLYVKENSVVTIKSDVLNNGYFAQEGTLALSGNWKNNNTYYSEHGTISLTGTQFQIFDHNDQAVHNLLINNGENVRFTSNLKINGKLKLIRGIITPDLGVQLVLTEKAIIEGGSADAYVGGQLFHTGLGNKFYPIGKHGQYAPVTLTQISGNEPVVGLEFHDTGLTSSSDDILQWLGDGFFWQLTRQSGDFEGSPLTLSMDVNYFPLETERLLIAVSNNLKQGFGILAESDFQRQGDKYTISSSLPLQHQYFTIGVKNVEKTIIYIPNVLSPLATNVEDQTAKIYSEAIIAEDFLWIIRDNWGHVVYTTDSYEEASTIGWQGNGQQGSPVLPGVFHYVVKGKLKNGDVFSKKGNLMLLK